MTTESDVVATRQQVREAAKAMGFGLTDITRIVTSVSELTRNIYVYAGEGQVHWNYVEDKAKKGIEIVFEDQGPGIENLEHAMEPGLSTGKGLGMGLVGSKRLMDEFDIQTKVGVGTTVTIRKWV